MSSGDTTLSLLLSRVLDEIGVNGECVLRLRRRNLLSERIRSLINLRKVPGQIFIFGSQTEATLTPGMNSDFDCLQTIELCNYIWDYKDWRPGEMNYLIVSQESEYPGHCILQALDPETPVPLGEFPTVKHLRDGEGRILLLNTVIDNAIPSASRHGPALTWDPSFSNAYSNDFVYGFYCKSWPKQFKRFSLPRQEVDHWPTRETLANIETTGCFIVAASTDLPREKWRLSTSLAERQLMFSLNITQLRCFILIKLIVKTFISPIVPGSITSYMCKTVMFYCLEQTCADFWLPYKLVQCVNYVIAHIIAALNGLRCPNYFNSNDNLFLGRVDSSNKKRLLKLFRAVLKSEGQYLFKIKIDGIGELLAAYIENSPNIKSLIVNERIREEICAFNCIELFGSINIAMNLDIEAHKLKKDWSEFVKSYSVYAQSGHLQSRAVHLVYPFLCAYMASIEASEAIHSEIEPSPGTFRLYQLSLNSDATSSRLKYASYLYCSGQFERAQCVLDDTRSRLSEYTQVVCPCRDRPFASYNVMFGEKEREHDYPSPRNVAMCTIFSSAERHCCPRELQFELDRSTSAERSKRTIEDDMWMDLAAVDSLPYLYFLLSMTLRHLGQRSKMLVVLGKLAHIIDRDRLILSHRETACNLLGQCMELENNFDEALVWYKRSLQERYENNAAKVHISRLMTSKYLEQTGNSESGRCAQFGCCIQ